MPHLDRRFNRISGRVERARRGVKGRVCSHSGRLCLFCAQSRMEEILFEDDVLNWCLGDFRGGSEPMKRRINRKNSVNDGRSFGCLLGSERKRRVPTGDCRDAGRRAILFRNWANGS